MWRSYCQGSTRVANGGTTGVNPRARANWRVSQLACLVTLIRPVHEERGTVVLLTKAIQQLTSFWSVVGLSGGNV